jgi:hypothetical protein
MLDNNQLQSWAKQVKEALGLSHFDVYLRGNDIRLNMIAVPKENRKSGVGSKALQLLTALADQHGLRITLVTGLRDPHFGTTSKSRLIDFYKRFGFVQNSGRNKDFTITDNMYRNPKGNTPVKESRNLSFKNYLINEMALHDYKTIGDFNKNSSFRDPRDRKILQHPVSIDRTRKKFGNTHWDFDFYFVNSAKANKHTEVGLVKPEWVKANLGDEVYNAIEPNLDQDHIQVIFTNNKGSERKNMTAWIMAHRIGHACARTNGMRDAHNQYAHASNHLISTISNILSDYGLQGFSTNERQILSNRRNQLAMLYFFYEISTFRSARERTVRDWFEILNELIAQYLTTGKIKFKPAPKSFGGGAGASKQGYALRGDYEDVNDMVQTLARDMEFLIDDIFSSLVNSVMVM